MITKIPLILDMRNHRCIRLITEVYSCALPSETTNGSRTGLPRPESEATGWTWSRPHSVLHDYRYIAMCLRFRVYVLPSWICLTSLLVHIDSDRGSLKSIAKVNKQATRTVCYDLAVNWCCSELVGCTWKLARGVFMLNGPCGTYNALFQSF